MKNMMWVGMTSILLLAMPLQAADEPTTIAVYSARGDIADEDLYSDFVETTGIEVERTISSSAATLDALENEDEDSPADLMLLNGVALLAEAQDRGLIQPVQSEALNQRIPEQWRAASIDQLGVSWFGLSRQARVVVYQQDDVDASDIDTYEKLASDKNKGQLCMAHPSGAANLGLLAAMIEHEGKAKAETWLQGLQSNLAHAPSDSDADAIRSLAKGDCKIGLANQADLIRLMHSDESDERDAIRSLAVLFPNQDAWGTYVDVSGAALARHGKHPEEALDFLEYLVSQPGQERFANDNNAWSVVEAYEFDNPDLQALGAKNGDFKSDATPLHKIAQHLNDARELLKKLDFDSATEDES